MSGKLLVVAEIKTVGGALRDEALERFKSIGRTVYEDEPGTTKYAVFIPREDDGQTLWVVEEFRDHDSANIHSTSQPVADTQNWLATESVLSGTPAIRTLAYISSEFEFSRPQAEKHTDPHVIFAELDYVSGGVDIATSYWKAVVDTGRENEPGTLAYGVLKDLQKDEKLATFEAYESPEYLKDVHVPSDAISESIKNTKHLRTGLKHHLLKKVSGFLYRRV